MKRAKSGTKGVYEKIEGSGIWWIRYKDASGRIRREKIGAKSAATQLVEKRRNEARERKKLPENFRSLVRVKDLVPRYDSVPRKKHSAIWITLSAV
jgi:hypothetical protein